MNSRERVLTAINHKEPDRVPLFFNGIDTKLMRALGTERWPRYGSDSVKTTIESFEKAGLRKEVKTIVGGAPLTEKFAREIGADGYAPDAASAVDVVISLLAG